MNCPNCNAPLNANSSFCPECGTALYANKPTVVPDGSDGGMLAMSIVGVALCWLPILGMVLGIVARSKSTKFLNTYGRLTPKARVARYIGMAAIVSGVFFTLYWAIIIFAIVASVM